MNAQQQQRVQRHILSHFHVLGMTLAPPALKLLLRECNKNRSTGTTTTPKKPFTEEGVLSQATTLINRIIQYIETQPGSVGYSVVDAPTLEQFLQSSVYLENTKVEFDCWSFLNIQDFPRTTYDQRRKTWIEIPAGSLHGSSDDKANMFRERYRWAQQRILRNELFSPKLIPQDSKESFSLTNIESLKGSTGHKCVLGMLTIITEGQFYLEDLNANVPLDLSSAEKTDGLFTEYSLVLVEGEMIAERNVFRVDTMGFPPAEPRQESLRILGGIDLFGKKTPPALLPHLQLHESEQGQFDFMIVISDVWLDKAQTLSKLRRLFSAFSQNPPAVFVLLGNFASAPHSPAFERGGDDKNTEALFISLGDIIAAEPLIARSSKFVIVPGPSDPCGGSADPLPRPPIPRAMVGGLEKVLPTGNLFLATNPCRIRYCTQEIVIFREDIVNKMRRNCVVFPQDSDVTITQHLAKTLCDQGHLCPLPLSVRPIHWNFDYTLNIFPLPDAIILADRYAKYTHKYTGCLTFNPGSFPVEYSFVVYRPSSKSIELSVLPEGEE